MSEANRYQVASMFTEDGGKISYQNDGPWVVLAHYYDAALSKLAAETLRADTAEAEVERLEEEFDTGEHSLITLKLKLAAAEQRVLDCVTLLRRSAEGQGQDPKTWWNERALILQAVLNPKPEAGSHE